MAWKGGSTIKKTNSQNTGAGTTHAHTQAGGRGRCSPPGAAVTELSGMLAWVGVCGMRYVYVFAGGEERDAMHRQQRREKPARADHAVPGSPTAGAAAAAAAISLGGTALCTAPCVLLCTAQ